MSEKPHRTQSRAQPSAEPGDEPQAMKADPQAGRKGHEAKPAGPADASASDQSAKEIERLKQEIQQAKDQYLRTLAEFDNTKKRLHREKEEFVRYAAQSIARELLPIVDSLDQALVAVDKRSDTEAVIKGVHLIYRQLLGLLDKEGVKRIPTIGQSFDPHLHEAVAQVEADDHQADGTIIEEVQVGYTLHDKVLRPALVKVAKKNSPQSTDNRQETTEENKEEAKE